MQILLPMCTDVHTHTFHLLLTYTHTFHPPPALPKHSPHKWTPKLKKDQHHPYPLSLIPSPPPPPPHIHTLTESKTVFWRNMWAVLWELSEEEPWRQRETHPDRQRNQITLAAGEGEEKEREREKGKKRERERGKKVGEVWREEGRGKEGKEEDIVLLECITINEFPDNRK